MSETDQQSPRDALDGATLKRTVRGKRFRVRARPCGPVLEPVGDDDLGDARYESYADLLSAVAGGIYYDVDGDATDALVAIVGEGRGDG